MRPHSALALLPVLPLLLGLELAAQQRRPAAATPLVIAHRGASGYRPEHTLAAYELAVRQGADYVEPDLVCTKDKVLVARHEPMIGGTTDVGAKFAERRRTSEVDGARVDDWFVEDFTLGELKTLRARERVPTRAREYDGRFEIPTLDEVLLLVRRLERETGRTIGVYPETKHPTRARANGCPMEELLVETLSRHGYRGREAPVFIQSFEVGNLQRLRGITRIRLVQLVSDSLGPVDRPGVRARELVTPAGLAAIARYADGVGVHRALVLPASDDPEARTPVVEDAHRQRLVVHVWTVRAGYGTQPETLFAAFASEVRRLARLGVDGIFTDHPALAVRALRER